MNKTRVLYVEDNSATRESFYQLLKKRYYLEVDCAVNGQEGLEMFSKNPEAYELVITDIAMPRLDGITMIEKMKNTKPQLLSLVISGRGDQDELIRAIEIGVDRFLLKPVEISTLGIALERVLGNSEIVKPVE